MSRLSDLLGVPDSPSNGGGSDHSSTTPAGDPPDGGATPAADPAGSGDPAADTAAGSAAAAPADSTAPAPDATPAPKPGLAERAKKWATEELGLPANHLVVGVAAMFVGLMVGGAVLWGLVSPVRATLSRYIHIPNAPHRLVGLSGPIPAPIVLLILVAAVIYTLSKWEDVKKQSIGMKLAPGAVLGLLASSLLPVITVSAIAGVAATVLVVLTWAKLRKSLKARKAPESSELASKQQQLLSRALMCLAAAALLLSLPLHDGGWQLSLNGGLKPVAAAPSVFSGPSDQGGQGSAASDSGQTGPQDITCDAGIAASCRADLVIGQNALQHLYDDNVSICEAAKGNARAECDALAPYSGVLPAHKQLLGTAAGALLDAGGGKVTCDAAKSAACGDDLKAVATNLRHVLDDKTGITAVCAAVTEVAGQRCTAAATHIEEAKSFLIKLDVITKKIK